MIPDVRALAPGEVAARLPEVAALRIVVFAEWPYLYDGDPDYEARYLRPYAESAGALVVGAFDGDRLVGAATAAPMEDHAAAFAEPLTGLGLAPGDVYYLAESVLLPAWRGRGVGHRFLDLREGRARALGRRWAAFCAVIRPDDHPARPPAHRPLDGFWRARGYAPVPGAVARFAWRDRGEAAETEKPMRMWLRAL